MSAYSSWASMRYVQSKKPTESPKTRSELHCWLSHHIPEDFPFSWNMFKEGPRYALQVGKIIAATDVRCLAMTSFGWWMEQILRHVGAEGYSKRLPT